MAAVKPDKSHLSSSPRYDLFNKSRLLDLDFELDSFYPFFSFLSSERAFLQAVQMLSNRALQAAMLLALPGNFGSRKWDK
jgi:hypothetical protein